MGIPRSEIETPCVFRFSDPSEGQDWEDDEPDTEITIEEL